MTATTKALSRKARAALAAGLSLTAITLSHGLSSSAHAGTGPVAFRGSVAYTDGDGVALRHSATATGKIQPVIVWGEGREVPIICQAWSSDGSAVGPRSNRIFNKVHYSGYSGDTWVPDAYVRGTAAANNFTNGIPRCGGSSTPPQQPPSSSDAPVVWVGSPIDGTWDVPANRGGDGAAAHHWLANASDKGSFAIDLVAGAGQAVNVYAAPQNNNVSVTAKVTQIGAACRRGNGGSFVTVSFYQGSTRIGSATYAHITPSVSVNQVVNRWGTKIGTVGSGYPKNNECWTGPHVHTQVFSVRNHACFNGGYRLGQGIRKTNFFAFTGGNVANGPKQACR